MDAKEPFLSRWSRRKLEAKEDAPATLPVEQPRAAATAPPPPATTGLQAAETSAGASAEYREFFDPRVDEKLRRTALKQLFGDPHFNTMDGLDTYIDDYSLPDPIPEAMLRQLNQAKALFLFDEQKEDGAAAAGGLDAGAAATPASPLGSDASAPTELPAPAAAATDAADSAVPLGSDARSRS